MLRFVSTRKFDWGTYVTASLYDRLGGFKTVRKIISDFYDRVLDEDDLSPHFAETDMASLIDHQTPIATVNVD